MGRDVDYAQMRYFALTKEKPRVYVHQGWKNVCLREICALSGLSENDIDVIEDETIEEGENRIGMDASTLHWIRLNPFACPQGYMPAAHIENLSVMIERCFDLSLNMRWLLRAAIRKTYIRCGWDLSGICANGTKMRVPTFYDLLAELSEGADEICGGSGKDAAREMILRLRVLIQDMAERIFLSETEMDSALLSGDARIVLEHIWPSELRAVLTAALLLRMKEERQRKTYVFPWEEEQEKKTVSHVIGEIYRMQNKLPERSNIENILDCGEVSCARKEEILAQYDLLSQRVRSCGSITRKDRAAFVIRVSGCAGIAQRIPLIISGHKPEEAYRQYQSWKQSVSSAMEAYIVSGMPNRAGKMASDLLIYMAQVVRDDRYRKMLNTLKTYEDAYFEMPKDDILLT